MTKWARLWTAALCLAAATAWFAGLEHRGLFIPDEGRYAEIAREMLFTMDWVTPRLNGLKYFEKPPLQYWMTAVSFSLFGEDEWTSRLAPALLGFAALLIVGYTGARLAGLRAGVLGATVLGSSWAYFLGAQYLTLDMTLAACLAATLCSFILGQSADVVRQPRIRSGWMLAAWACAGAAVLAKGLVGIVLPAAAIAAYKALHPAGLRFRNLQIAPGAALFLAIVLPWFLLVQWRNPEFFQLFFIREHFQRFLEGHGRPGPWWYYAPILVLGLTPWTPALVQLAVRRRRTLPAPPAGFCAMWFCAAWAAIIVLFFSLSHSKLPAYILPALPALALLIGRYASEDTANRLRGSSQGAFALGLGFLLAVPLLPAWPKFAQLGEQALIQLPWLYAASAVLAASGLAAWRECVKQRGLRAALALAAGAIIFWNCVFTYFHTLDARFSSERLIEQLTGERRPFQPEAPFFSVEQFDPSVPFYLGRTVTLVAVRGELGPGIDAEPHQAISTTEQFAARWTKSDVQAFAILPPDAFARLLQEGLPMIQVLRDERLVIVRRH